MHGAEQEEIFAEARRLTRWHYQWIALFDFVERLTELGLVRRIKHDGRRFYRFKTLPYIPAEFSGAAYRLGHSMIRERYDHNRVFLANSSFPATLGALFDFTGKSGMILGDNEPPTTRESLTGQVPPLPSLPSNWVIDWRRFFEVEGSDQVRINPSRKIDPFLTPALATLPGELDRNAMLAFRNLKRGVQLGLPSGQDVARIMGLTPMSTEDIGSGPDGAVAAEHGLTDATPLWYYILKEAQGAPRRHPPWPRRLDDRGRDVPRPRPRRPQKLSLAAERLAARAPSAESGQFTMSDLLAFVGEINPVG